jgi:hypothetical protein
MGMCAWIHCGGPNEVGDEPVYNVYKSFEGSWFAPLWCGVNFFACASVQTPLWSMLVLSSSEVVHVVRVMHVAVVLTL